MLKHPALPNLPNMVRMSWGNLSSSTPYMRPAAMQDRPGKSFNEDFLFAQLLIFFYKNSYLKKHKDGPASPAVHYKGSKKVTYIMQFDQIFS